MSPKLAILERKMARQSSAQAPAPEGGHGLGAAIEKLIADEVERRVGEAVEQRPSPRVRRLFNAPAPVSDYRELPPVAKTAPKKSLNMLIHRDAAGQILWAEMDGMKVELVRDGAGRAIAMREITESPVLPPLDIADKTKARQYQPGETR